MRSNVFFMAIVAAMLVSVPVFAQSTAVTVDSTIHLSSVSGADSYQVKLTLVDGVTDLQLFDPPTNDPNQDKIADVASNPDGTADVSLSIWLTGANLGDYIIHARSLDTNGNFGAWSTLTISYGAPEPPAITIT